MRTMKAAVILIVAMLIICVIALRSPTAFPSKLMGADAGGRWGEMTSQFFGMIKNSGANVYFFSANLDTWRDNAGFRTKTAQISQWCKQRGLKLIWSISGTQWDPPRAAIQCEAT